MVIGRVRIFVAIFIISVLGGCFSSTPDGQEAGTEGSLDVIDESLSHVAVAFRAITRSGGEVDVAGVTWVAEDADAAVLLVNDSGGGMLSIWGPLEVPGYSFAHVLTTSGHSVVSISLPAYGDTQGADNLVGIEDYAFVVDQVSAALRTGDYTAAEGATPHAYSTIVGMGLSMGGLLMDVTQGLFASFDGIVPMGWSHGLYSQEAALCFSGGSCPEDDYVWSFHMENMEPAVPEALVNVTDPSRRPYPEMIGISMGVWSNCISCFAYELRPVDEARPAWTRPDEVTRLIDVPVLNTQGEKDFYWAPEDLPNQGDHYPNADFTLLLLPETGHFMLHHLNHREVHQSVLEWMDRHDL